MSQTLPSKERLKQGTEFKSVLERGRRVKKANLAVWAAPNGLAFNRIGVSAPRRNFKLASERNKARRLLKEAYRRNKIKLCRGFDIVIMLKDTAPALSQLETGLIGIFADMELLK
ncbi:MAG: ribonuclease P protein component [Candidatus Omnitrophota bacterium]